MNQLKIFDLSFLETEVANSGEVQGGTGAVYQPVSSLSVAYNASVYANYSGGWSVIQDARGGYAVVANIYATGGGAVAAAAAGAASDGPKFTATYAQTSAY